MQSTRRSFLSENRTSLIILLVVALALYALSTIKNTYHKAEIKALETQIENREKDFRKVLEEKIKLQDSSNYYERIARESGAEAAFYKTKAEEERRAKEKALRILASIPKEVIDSFFAQRYRDVPKSNIALSVDKNVGNEIVIELVEKDHLERELGLVQQENNALDSQVVSLGNSLKFSKEALLQADSAIIIKVQQLDLSKQSSDLLKKDLNTAKKEAFWNKWKGAGVGVAVGLVLGLLSQ